MTFCDPLEFSCNATSSTWWIDTISTLRLDMYSPSHIQPAGPALARSEPVRQAQLRSWAKAIVEIARVERQDAHPTPEDSVAALGVPSKYPVSARSLICV